LNAVVAPADDVGETITVGAVVLNTTARRVLVGGTPLVLTSAEYQVLGYLMRNAGQVVTRGDLERSIYGEVAPASNVLQVYLGRLRKKLEAAGCSAIHTVWGTGYRYELPKAVAP
jgi:DNA-binding response OmpR family regulator